MHRQQKTCGQQSLCTHSSTTKRQMGHTRSGKCPEKRLTARQESFGVANFGPAFASTSSKVMSVARPASPSTLLSPAVAICSLSPLFSTSRVLGCPSFIVTEVCELVAPFVPIFISTVGAPLNVSEAFQQTQNKKKVVRYLQCSV